MEVKKIDHIGIAVGDLGSAKRFYEESLGLRVEREETLGEMEIAFVPLGGVNIELIQSTTPEGVISKFIAKRGEGIHHIAFLVDDIDKETDMLVKKGFEVIFSQKFGEGGCAFFDTGKVGGVFIELFRPPS